MSEEIKAAPKKAAPKKVSVKILRRCSDLEGNEYNEGDEAELEKSLAQKFLDNGVIEAKL